MMTVNRILSDTVMVVVHCPETDSYVLSRSPSNGWSIPYSDCSQGSWSKGAASLYRKLMGNAETTPLQLVKTFRVWHVNDEYLHSLAFYSKVDEASLKDVKSGDGVENYEIANLELIVSLVKEKKLTPEALEILDVDERGQRISSPSFIEITKEDLMCHSDSGNTLTAFINSGIPESEQTALYYFYLDATFPYLKMDEPSMDLFMRKLGVSSFTEDHFRAADISNSGAIDFKQVLGFIAAVKGTSKDKSSTEECCRYIFRYYDKNRDGKLGLKELEELLEQMSTSRLNLKKTILESTTQEFVSEDEFVRMVGSQQLRGLSALMVNPSLPAALKTLKIRSSDHLRTSRDSTSVQRPLIPRQSYSIGCHVVTLTTNGEVVPSALRNIDSAVKSDSSKPDAVIPTASSLETFEGSSPAANIITALKYFTENVLSSTEDQHKWFEGSFPKFPDDIKDCCNLAKRIFENEQRLLKVDSPVYVIGDVHGRYNDLINFQKHFWNLGIECIPGSVLFLGDYVDRGKHGVEVITYLIAQKVKNPKKLYLLRGNHESRKVQKEHTFFTECLTKFENGGEIWEALNEVFDRMPLAALVDEEIFCCHGGIPMPSQCESLDDINKIPCPLPNPADNKLAWALLWNDPLKLGYNSIVGKNNLEGFSKNSRRKTGHTFDNKALSSFIKKHGLSYVVRAHEVQDAGFQVDLDSRLITVFSSSNYRGNNSSGCVLVQKNKLRIFMLAAALPRASTT